MATKIPLKLRYYCNWGVWKLPLSKNLSAKSTSFAVAALQGGPHAAFCYWTGLAKLAVPCCEAVEDTFAKSFRERTAWRRQEAHHISFGLSPSECACLAVWARQLLRGWEVTASSFVPGECQYVLSCIWKQLSWVWLEFQCSEFSVTVNTTWN